MNFDSILLIVGLSVLTAISMYMPFKLLINLLLTSALLKYSFSCLDNTSHGVMKAPDVTDAYGGGFGLALQVIFMVIAVSSVIWVTGYFLGSMLASIVAIILIAGFPAMMINFAMTENILEALNPLKMLNLMSSIGLPYGLLLAFIMIMSGSIGVISQFIPADFSIVSLSLQSMVTNYYIIVIFHIMGYMIYQFQDELSFESSTIHGSDKPQRSVLQKNLSHIDILLKEGEFDEGIKLYSELTKTYPEDNKIKSDYFELLLATRSIEQLNIFAPKYLDNLVTINREDTISLNYKRILKVNPQFKLVTIDQRIKLAKICSQKGDSQSVIKLVNGLHKDYPGDKNLVKAYELMHKALLNLPNLKAQAEQCQKLINRLKASK